MKKPRYKGHCLLSNRKMQSISNKHTVEDILPTSAVQSVLLDAYRWILPRLSIRISFMSLCPDLTETFLDIRHCGKVHSTLASWRYGWDHHIHLSKVFWFPDENLKRPIKFLIVDAVPSRSKYLQQWRRNCCGPIFDTQNRSRYLTCLRARAVNLNTNFWGRNDFRAAFRVKLTFVLRLTRSMMEIRTSQKRKDRMIPTKFIERPSLLAMITIVSVAARGYHGICTVY